MTVSFWHGGTEEHASYRYRARRPAEALEGALNDPDAQIIIFAKPHEENLPQLRRANEVGRITIVDTCDIHWQREGIKAMMQEAMALTANTPFLANLIAQQFTRSVTVIDDPYEYDEAPPHCQGAHLLWYGHPSNGDSFNRIASLMQEYPFEIVTRKKNCTMNADLVTEWSPEAQAAALARADMVVIPETAPYKSANRTIEAVRQGCFVVAEPHPSLEGFPGIWIGNIPKGVQWAETHQEEARERTAEAQSYIREKYSLGRVVSAWRSLFQDLACTSAPDINAGQGGSISMDSWAPASPILPPISTPSLLRAG